MSNSKNDSKDRHTKLNEYFILCLDPQQLLKVRGILSWIEKGNLPYKMAWANTILFIRKSCYNWTLTFSCYTFGHSCAHSTLVP